MRNLLTDGAGDSMIFTAKLLSSERITPESSREDIRRMVFRTDNLYFDSKVGSCVRILAPGQYGNPYHTRLYFIADSESSDDGASYEICVRRCFYVDDASGEEYAGVASNYLCDLKPGSEIRFSGPVGYPFLVPENQNANLLMIGMGTGIAPFRGLVRMIYEQHGGWKGKVRLFYGARTGLESLYMNDVNNDIGNYFDQPTFKAFQAVSPRPHLGEPIALEQAMEKNKEEVWAMIQDPNTYVFVAGLKKAAEMLDNALGKIAGSQERWLNKKAELKAGSRFAELIY
jgi:sulfite reductase alpha subunit-like flavoprotein